MTSYNVKLEDFYPGFKTLEDLKDVIPYGYKAIDFRPPNVGEKYMSRTYVVYTTFYPECYPRVILQKIPTTVNPATATLCSVSDIYPSGVSIPEGYIYDGFRMVKYEEYFIKCPGTARETNGGVGKVKLGDNLPNGPRVILRRV